MDLRRVLLILAVLLLIAAGAASLAPPPEEESETAPTSTPTTGTREAEATERGEAVEAELEAGGAKGRPEEVRVDAGARVVVTVSVPSPGQVELEGLGRVDAAEPGTPAVFDLLADRPGRYEAVFTPTEGRARTVGAIVVGGEGEAGGSGPGSGKTRPEG